MNGDWEGELLTVLVLWGLLYVYKLYKDFNRKAGIFKQKQTKWKLKN